MYSPASGCGAAAACIPGMDNVLQLFFEGEEYKTIGRIPPPLQMPRINTVATSRREAVHRMHWRLNS